MTCDAQGRVKKIRPVKWTEGGEDRSQVLPFDILPCFFAAPFCLSRMSCESSTKCPPLGHMFVLQGRGKDVLTKVSLNAPPVDVWDRVCAAAIARSSLQPLL